MTSVRRMLRNPLLVVLLVVLAWFVTTFLLLPNLAVLRTVLVADDGALSWRAVERLLGSERAMSALRNSVVLAAVLSVTVNVVGVFLVLVTRYFAVRGARILWVGYATTLVYGGIVQVAAFRIVYGPDGVVTRVLQAVVPGLDRDWFSGMLAVVLVMTLSGTGLHLLFLSAAIAKIDLQTVEAARMLGASAWTVLWRVVLPALRPMIFAVTILTFLGGLGALAAPQVLGGSEFQTIAPMILTFSGSLTSRDLAATLAVVLGLATAVLLVVLNRAERGGVYFSVSKVPAPLVRQRIDHPGANAVVHVVAYLLFLVYAVPPVLVVLFSFTDARSISTGTLSPASFTLENYAAVLTDQDAYLPFLVSVGYGAVTAVVVLAAMLPTARMIQRYRNPLTTMVEYLLHIPWILPSTLLALGLIVTFDHPQPLVLGQVLTGSVGLLAVAYVVAKIPFTFRLLKAAFAAVPDNLEDAATMLGAGPLHTFRRVLLPLVVPTAVAVTALNFNSLLDDYDSAVFLSHPFYPPLGIVIRNATSGETTTDATALTFVYTVLLMAVSALVLWLVHGRESTGRRTRRTTRHGSRPRSDPQPRPADHSGE